MGAEAEARLMWPAERDEVVAHLSHAALDNLMLLDMAARLGTRPSPGEMRGRIALAKRGGEIVGVVGLRPSVVFDSQTTSQGLEALMPFLDAISVGLVKSPAVVVNAFWEQQVRRRRRRANIDRIEIAYARKADASAPDPIAAVRPATVADLDPLVMAARESLREEGRPDPFVGDVRGFRRWVKGRVPRARVVEDAGRVVFVAYADVQRAEGWLLQGVYTWPEARGRGFARTGVDALCREAFGCGADHVQLAVVDGNVAAQRLYESLGFQAFGRLRTILFTEA